MGTAVLRHFSSLSLQTNPSASARIISLPLHLWNSSSTHNKFSVSPMTSHLEDKKENFDDQSKKDVCKGACGFNNASKGLPADHIIPHIFSLYGSCPTPDDFNIYAPNATFEDPLMCAHGVAQIKSAFYSISKVFSESRIVEYNIEQHEISPGKHEILIDNKQHYKILGKSIDMVSLIKLYIEGGKVVRHEDWWNKNPILNRDTTKVSFAGRTLEIVRRGSMMATHVLMRFGKDQVK